MADEIPQEESLNRTAKLRQHISKKRLLLGLVILALLAGGAYLIYDYKQLKEETQRLSNPQVAAEEATKKLILDVGALVELPAGETPTIATVSDVSKLRNQAFFAKAENGDKVLIYTQAKRAILYRPSTNKVIEIAPVNLGSSPDNSSTPGGSNNSNGNNTNNAPTTNLRD